MKNFMQHDFNVDEIILCCYLPNGMGDNVHKNRASHGLALMVGGEKHYTFDNGRSITVHDGDMIYLPKGSSYSVFSITRGDCYAINFNVSEEFTSSPFSVHIKNSRDMVSAFQHAERNWRTKRQGFHMKCKEKLYHIIIQIQREYLDDYTAKNKNDIIAPALTYIHENYTEKTISVSELSDMCHITPEYFRRIFGRFYGTSPIKYINDLKLSHAKDLLRSGEYSVSETATLSGFVDISHFSRVFKKATGLSPKDFVRS